MPLVSENINFYIRIRWLGHASVRALAGIRRITSGPESVKGEVYPNIYFSLVPVFGLLSRMVFVPGS